jgi:hypothetical protein
LADCRHSLEFWGGVVGEEQRLDLFVEGGFAGVVEAEEEDGVFWDFSEGALDFERARHTFFTCCVQVQSFG